MIPLLAMTLSNKILFSFLVAVSILLAARYTMRPANKSWSMIMPAPIATSVAFPQEFGGLTVLDHSIYLSLENGLFYRLNHDGKLLWSFSMQDYTIFPPQEDGGKTYITSFDGRLYAIETESGKEVWRFTTPEYIKADTEPLVSGDFVFFGSRNGALYALDKKTGKIIWTFQTTQKDSTRYSPNKPIIHFGRFTVDKDSVYINSATDNTLYALDTTNGEIRWRLQNYGFVYQKPIVSDEIASIQTSAGDTLALDRQTGAVREKKHTDTVKEIKPLFEDPNIDAQQTRERNGYVYLLTKDKMNVVKVSKSNQQTPIQLSTIPKRSLASKPKTPLITSSQTISVDEAEKTSRQNEIYTIKLKHEDSQYTNPNNTNILATFSSPHGNKYSIRAFYFDKNTWMIRFAPQEQGRWTWSVSINESKKPSIKGHVEVSPSNNSGYLKLSLKNTKAFSVGNKVIVPLGIQDCFRDYNHDGSPLDQWFPGISAQPVKNPTQIQATSMNEYLTLYKKGGFNLWRYGVGNCAKTLWHEVSPIGNRYALNESYYVDKLFEGLRANDYFIWMSLLSFTLPFDSKTIQKDQETMLKDYLDYVVARYAAYIDVWELANEIHLTDETIDMMTAYLRSIDPYKHPITTNWERPDSQAIEINSLHWYDAECDLYCNRNIELQVEKYKNLQKPTVLSEVGNRDANWDIHSADRMRVRLWIGFFRNLWPIFWNSSQAYYSSPHGASNIYLGPIERMYTSVFTDMTKGVQEAQDANITTSSDGVVIFSRKSQTNTLAYLYRNIYASDRLSAVIQIPAHEAKTLEWVDPKTGKILRAESLKNTAQTITSPPFATDIILKLIYNK